MTRKFIVKMCLVSILRICRPDIFFLEIANALQGSMFIKKLSGRLNSIKFMRDSGRPLASLKLLTGEVFFSPQGSTVSNFGVSARDGDFGDKRPVKLTIIEGMCLAHLKLIFLS